MEEKSAVLEQVELVLNEARPYLEGHGGGIQLVDVDAEGIVHVALQGHCVGCALSTITMRLGIETLLKDRLPAIVKGVQEI